MSELRVHIWANEEEANKLKSLGIPLNSAGHAVYDAENFRSDKIFDKLPPVLRTAFQKAQAEMEKKLPRALDLVSVFKSKYVFLEQNYTKNKSGKVVLQHIRRNNVDPVRTVSAPIEGYPGARLTLSKYPWWAKTPV